MMNERFQLSIQRIEEIAGEELIAEPFLSYFRNVTDFVLMIKDTYEKIQDGFLKKASLEELQKVNYELYKDILADDYGENHYAVSYANPGYATKQLGDGYGQLLSFLYAEMRSMIPFAFEGLLEELVIRMELFIEIYDSFVYAKEDDMLPAAETLKETMYWFISDYSDVETEWRVRTQVEPDERFAVNIVMNSNLDDVRFLYQYGEYVAERDLQTARFISQLPEEKLQLIADTFSEGYRIGFVLGNKDLSRKETVDVRFCLGFEKIIKKTIENFEKMGLKPTMYRAAQSIFHKRSNIKIGYYGSIPNKQYEYDHKEDDALFLDKKLMNRKLEVYKAALEEHKAAANKHAGPAVMEIFGEIPFEPKSNPDACKLSQVQQKLSAEYRGTAANIVNQYIIGEERSFSIIAFPVPDIGEKFEEIFEETIRINTLDYKTYERIQNVIINTLDKATHVHIKGMNGNKTELTVQLHKLENPEKETIFENCVADVNIPVGEVFTSPVLKGTNGTLFVSKVFLDELGYENLEITFKDGMIDTYSCTNFESEEENKAYLKENVLFHYDSLPMGEFAIGTNTTAYVVTNRYGIADRMPILIAEKMGPHFAVGDTCYSHAEDVKVYNPNGKEIIARDNEVSIQRKTDASKAYFGCHTDITIPYNELGEIVAVTEDGERITIIENGRFVLAGCEELNKPFDE